MGLPGSNVESLDLKARNGQINDTLLNDVEGDGGTSLDDGVEGEGGRDIDRITGLQHNGEGRNGSGINRPHGGIGSI